MSETSVTENVAIVKDIEDHLKPIQALGIFFLGALLVILGGAAIIVPTVSSMVVEMAIGLLLIVGGIFKLVMSFRERKTKGFWLLFLLSLVYIAAGALFIGFPVTGLVALTTVLLFFFLLEGAGLIWFSLLWKPSRGWGWIFTSGILSLLLAVLILAGWPLNVYWIPGIIVGIDLLITGLTFIIFSIHSRVAHD